MTGRDQNEDVRAIKALISERFRSGLQWTPGKPADWITFANGFLPDAPPFPAASPVRRQSVNAFIARMDGLARDKLRSFEETMLGMEVLVLGSVAVVLGASEMVENGTEVNRDVTGFLLVKDDGKWMIAAQAWDHETQAMPIPSIFATLESIRLKNPTLIPIAQCATPLTDECPLVAESSSLSIVHFKHACHRTTACRATRRERRAPEAER